MNIISNNLENKINDILFAKLGKRTSIKYINQVSGGCIHNTFRITTNNGLYFLKCNDDCEKKMFHVESKGLELLSSCESISTPQVISFDDEYLLMEFIESGVGNTDLWQEFGRSVADLHKISSINFGLDYNNFIGSLWQENTRKDTWLEFFITNRIIPLLRSGNFSSRAIKEFDSLFINLESIFPRESSSLLHGDLWNGNFLFSNNKFFLFDPAVYFGNREMDIAMTKLFGGFDKIFYDSYNEKFPLNDNWEERIGICNLYPLLVHANLFGGSYYSQVMNIVRRFN